MGLAIFDICDTLYAVNTTADFLRFFGQRHHPPLAARVERWTRRGRPAWWLGAAAHRIVGFDLAKRRMISGLAGFPLDLIEREADHYVTERLPHIANGPLMDRLQQHRQSGDAVWLLSSTIAPVAEAIGRSLDVPAHGSQLECRGDVCTGRLLSDLSGRKGQWLLTHAPSVERPMSVYTDNMSDLPLIDLADRATIVLPKGKTRHWAGEDHDYIQL